MSEPNVPPPPSYTPPPPPVGTPPTGTVSPNRTIMLILAYFGPLAVIPLVIEKNDPEVQWHAKHGLVLFVAEIILAIAIGIITHIMPFAACAFIFIWPLLAVLHIIMIVKAVNGQRLLIPGVSEFADRF